MNLDTLIKMVTKFAPMAFRLARNETLQKVLKIAWNLYANRKQARVISGSVSSEPVIPKRINPKRVSRKRVSPKRAGQKQLRKKQARQKGLSHNRAGQKRAVQTVARRAARI